MRWLIFILVGLLGLPLMPILIRNVFPWLPSALEEVEKPFYCLMESGQDGGPVLIQYYSPPLRHEVVLGDTNFMVPQDWPERVYRGPIGDLVPIGSRIVSLELEEGSGDLQVLSVKWDDIGPSGATFWYRESGGKLQAVWAAYSETSFLPLLGGRAWVAMELAWLVLVGVLVWIVGRKRKEQVVG